MIKHFKMPAKVTVNCDNCGKLLVHGDICYMQYDLHYCSEECAIEDGRNIEGQIAGGDDWGGGE